MEGELLHELFESSADRGPERVAVLFGEARLTYRELEERANRIARRLRELGAGREDRVALYLPRSAEVYAAMLGVLKAGAAYVPLDPQTPADRAAFILSDSGAKCLITVAGFADKLGESIPDGVAVVLLDAESAALEALSSARVPRAETGTAPESLCYVIYTSGTTGQPKGVQIEHRNAVSLVRAESSLYGVTRDDRILQFFSIAFDASVEEFWLAFFHGATLVPAAGDALRAGPEFTKLLSNLGVTVFSSVPTFVAMLEGDIPSLRIVILGGEICPESIARRWCRPGRTVFNTYGPTEATVIATASVLESSKPVTIGRPIANAQVFLLDDKLSLVVDGAEGELCIAGQGVARGYLNRPELDAEKFVVTDRPTGKPLRLYRTGDLARWTKDGELEYLGRADDQVKVRGYRVELSEVEAALMRCPGVQAAAVRLEPEGQRLAAFVVRASSGALDRSGVRETLAARLPPYMVPAFLDEIDALPMTSSGKIDRKRLPAAKTPLGQAARGRLPSPGAEKTVAEEWSSVLGRDGIGATDDFFKDLDGHSMLAATAVSRLRGRSGFSRVSIADLYAHPTVEGLARLSQTSAGGPAAAPFARVSQAAYFACAAGQAVGIFFLAGMYAWQWIGAYLAYGYLVVADWPVREALLAAFGVYAVTTPAVLALSIALKWLLLGRVKPGSYPLWGWFFLRFWFVRAMVRAAPLNYLAGTPLLNLYYRLMGARIGRDVYIGGEGLSTFDLLEIGDGSSVGMDTPLDGASVEGGLLKIAPVTIGRGCWIGNRCALGAGAVLEDGAGLDDLSMLPDGARVPAGELWRGSPARTAGRLESGPARPPWGAGSWAATVAGVFAFPLVILAAIFPGLMVITHLGHHDEGFFFLVAAPLVAVSFVCLLCLVVLAFKRLMVGRLRDECYPVGGWFYVRKWFFDQLMNLSLEVTGTLYTTLYLQPWLKALGARIGPRSEISTVRFIDPDLLEAGEECFLADDVLVGAPRVRAGWVTIGPARVGNRAFAGNSAVLPAGSTLGNNVLIGTLSIAPDRAADGGSWFGSPPIALPVRQRPEGFSEAQTYRPSRRLVALRLFIEFFRVILPSTIFVVLASLIVNATDVLQDYIGLAEWLSLVPLLYIAAGMLAMGATILLKKVLIGRYRVGRWPLWCGFVWRSELVTGVYENLGVLFFVDLLKGTPYIVWVLRALGMKIGRRCFVDTTWFTEFDLIELGEEAALNDNANVQTHLFEDRVFKTGPVLLGARCSLGAMSTVLYDAKMEEGSSLGDLSLLMKGESLPKGTRWRGIPAQRANEAFP